MPQFCQLICESVALVRTRSPLVAQPEPITGIVPAAHGYAWAWMWDGSRGGEEVTHYEPYSEKDSQLLDENFEASGSKATTEITLNGRKYVVPPAQSRSLRVPLVHSLINHFRQNHLDSTFKPVASMPKRLPTHSSHRCS